MLKEFKEFAMRGNVIDMAVGIVIGAAFTSIVKSLVGDMMMPVVGLITGGVDFSNVFITLKGGDFETLKAAQDAGAVTLNIGLFINAMISFVIVAFALFMLIKGMNQMKRKQEEKPEEAPPPPRDIQLLEEIRDALVKKKR
jgi:large conductance mechanosensitive channel